MDSYLSAIFKLCERLESTRQRPTMYRAGYKSSRLNLYLFHVLTNLKVFGNTVYILKKKVVSNTIS